MKFVSDEVLIVLKNRISLEAFTNKNANYHHHVVEPWCDEVLMKFDEVFFLKILNTNPTIN